MSRRVLVVSTGPITVTIPHVVTNNVPAEPITSGCDAPTLGASNRKERRADKSRKRRGW